MFSLFFRLILLALLLMGTLFPMSAQAQTRIINDGGGFCTFNGNTGGLRVHTSANGQFQVERCSAPGTVDRSRQFFFAGALPPSNILFNSMYLRVGNTIIGANNNAGVIGAQSFREISTSGGSGLGNGTSTTIYAADVGGLTYTITQTVSYVFPNDFYTVDIEIDVPNANTQEVDFYSWTDLMLDGDDNGQCIPQTTFPRFAGGDNTARNYFAGYRERDVSLSWDSFSCGFFADATRNGNQIIGPARSLPNTNFTNNIDIGAATHWEVVDTGGTGGIPFRAQFDFIFSVKQATLTKRFGPEDDDNNDTISAGEITDLTFMLTNVPGNPAIGPIAFTDTLPAGVEIVGTPDANQCRGTVSIGNIGGRDAVTLTNGALNGGEASCEVTLQVTGNTPGTFQNTAADITGIPVDVDGVPTAQNQVFAELEVVAPALPPFTCPAEIFQVYSGAGQIGSVDLLNNSFSNLPNSLGFSANAAGYRVSDNLVYAIAGEDFAPGGVVEGDLIRIGADGTFENIGDIDGINNSPNQGDFGPNGFLHVRNSGSDNINMVDVDTATVVATYNLGLNLPNAGDFAFNPADGFFYIAAFNETLYRFAPGVGAATIIGPVAPNDPSFNVAFGAMAGDADGNIYGVSNADGSVFQFDLSTGEATAIGVGAGATSNDGFYCPDATFVSPVGTVTGTVFIDDNENIVFDTGEPDVPDITIRAFEAGPDGQFGTADDIEAASAETGGLYTLFLPPGTYDIRIDLADPDLPASFRPSITTFLTVDIVAGDTITDQDFGIAAEATSEPPLPAPINAFCVAPANWRQLPYDTGANSSIRGGVVNSVIDGLTANVAVDGSANIVWETTAPSDTAVFDEAEHTTILPGLGRTNIIYDPSAITGLDQTFTQTFEGRAVYEIYAHFNSIDQVQLVFLQALNPDLGWELISSNDDLANISSRPDFAFVDVLEADHDVAPQDEISGGDAGLSADGTVRIYPLSGNPIEQLVWSFVEDPFSRNLPERIQWGTEVCIPLDFSDASTTGTSYGSASHSALSTIRLGDGITADPGPFDSADASADTNDDGVTFPELRTATPDNITISVTGAGGFLQGWIDWNGDGDFDDAGEQIATDVTDTGGAGTISLPVTPPADAVLGDTFARFRWSTMAGLDTTQDAPDGEVEDYQVAIQAGVIPVSGTVFFDNGAGTGATAHDGLIEGDEAGAGSVTVEAVDTDSGDVIATTQTDGDGTYTLDLPPEQDGRETQARVTLPSGVVLVSNMSADPGALANPSGGMFMFTPAVGDSFIGLDFGLAAEPRLTEDQSRTIVPGGATLIGHTFTAQTAMEVDFSFQNIVQSVDGIFSIVLFSDADCDSEIGAGDAVVAAPVSVVAGQQVCVLVRIASDARASEGVSVGYDLQARATYTGLAPDFAALLNPANLFNSDRITLSADGTLVLTKEVCNTSSGSCNIASGEGFVRTNKGAPGDILIYRILFEVAGPQPVDGLTIADKTPAFSSLTATAPSVVVAPDGLICALMEPAAPSVGVEGVLRWECTGEVAPGSIGIVSFEIQIAD